MIRQGQEYFLKHKFLHICECCGCVEELTAEEAHEAGWDYPPGIGTFGVFGPRTCRNCMMKDTAWWKITAEDIPYEELDEKYKETI